MRTYSEWMCVSRDRTREARKEVNHSQAFSYKEKCYQLSDAYKRSMNKDESLFTHVCVLCKDISSRWAISHKHTFFIILMFVMFDVLLSHFFQAHHCLIHNNKHIGLEMDDILNIWYYCLLIYVWRVTQNKTHHHHQNGENIRSENT